MQLVLILCLLPLAMVCTNANIASVPTTIVHNVPSAVSHQSFTRQITKRRQANSAAVLNHIQVPTYSAQLLAPAAHIVTPQAGNYEAKLILEQSEPAYAAFAGHTPAHLTFAASPVVHQVLPSIKPVRKISFDSFLPAGTHAIGFEH